MVERRVGCIYIVCDGVIFRKTELKQKQRAKSKKKKKKLGSVSFFKRGD